MIKLCSLPFLRCCWQAARGTAGLAILVVSLLLMAVQARAVARSSISQHNVIADIARAELVARFDVQGLDWGPAFDQSLHGVAIRTAMFQSSLDALSVADRLTRPAVSIFDRVLFAREQLVLSGLEGGWHWMAVISRHPDGAYGYVSRLDSRPPTSPPVSRDAGMISAVPGASSLFRLVDHDESTRSVHQVYRFAGRDQGIRQSVLRHLKRQGWHHSPTSGDDPDHWQGQRAGDHLSVMFVPRKSGQLVTVRHDSNRRQP